MKPITLEEYDQFNNEKREQVQSYYKSRLDDIDSRLPKFLTTAAFHLGQEWQKKSGRSQSMPWSFLRYTWKSSSRLYRLRLVPDLRVSLMGEISFGYSACEFAFGRWKEDDGKMLADDFIALTIAVEKRVRSAFGGIGRGENAWKICAGCGTVSICTKAFAMKWLCSACNVPQSQDYLDIPSAKGKAGERGKITPRIRFRILARDGFQCKACGVTPRVDNDVELQVDHILPVALGGRTVESNLQSLCKECNSGKAHTRVRKMEGPPFVGHQVVSV